MKGPKLNITNAVANRLAKFMSEKNLTQYKIAQLSGVPFSTIKHIMQRKTSDVNLKTIIMIANGLGLKPCEFLDDDSFLFENLDLD